VSLEIDSRKNGDVTVVYLAGKLNLGEGTRMICNSLYKLIEGGHRKLLLNLADVSYIDSAGLGEIVASYEAAHRSGGQLMLVGLTKPIRELMSATKLTSVFAIFEDEQTTVRSYDQS